MSIYKSLSIALMLLLATTGVAHAALATVDDSYGIPVSRLLTVEAFGVLENDTLDGQSAGLAGVTAELVTDASKGTLTCPDVGPGLCADGSFEYTPGAAFDGTDTFTYQAISANETSLPTTVTLTACSGGPQIYTCWQESSYLSKLSELGFSAFVESFEGVEWDVARSPDTALSIDSKGITWMPNHPAPNEITTGPGPARSGLWGVYDPKHGHATGSIAECDVADPPVHCFQHDGFRGSIAPGPDVLLGVGGYITGSAGAKLVIVLDGIQHDAGLLPDSGHHFSGVIDTTGFNAFEYRELEGTVSQLLLIFGDDFVIAKSGTLPPNNPPVLSPVGDQTTSENVQLSIPLSASDTDDGDVLSFYISGAPAGSVFYDNGDGTADFFWTPDSAQLGSHQVSFAVSDNAIPSASDSETITITVEPFFLDTDGDTVPDDADNCTLVSNPAQRDTDADGFGNYCDPDFDNNLVINSADLAHMKTQFFSPDPDADLTGDGIVNAGDLVILKSMFFQAPGPSGLLP